MGTELFVLGPKGTAGLAINPERQTRNGLGSLGFRIQGLGFAHNKGSMKIQSNQDL